MEVLEYCYSWPSEDRGQRKNRARAACLAARKMAIVVGRHGPTRNRWRLKADDLSEVYGKTSSKTLGEMRAKQGILSVGFCVGFKG